MKKFNLEEARKGKPICTRDGRKARIICWDYLDPIKGIIALILNENNREHIAEYREDGKCIESDGENKDLFMATVRHEGWVNIYRPARITDGYYRRMSCCYRSKVEAERYIDPEDKNYITTIKIEWEE